MDIDQASLAAWQAKLKEIGPRLTATDAHHRFIQFLQDQINELGFSSIRFPFKIKRCLQDSHHLLDEATGSPISNLGPVPYSGITDKNGVTGQLRFYHGKNDAEMKGKIAVIKVRDLMLPTFFLVGQMAHYPKQAKLTRNMRHPLVGATLAISKIQAAKASGAIGVILVWQHISTGLAKNEILPFTNAYLDIPAIWVHEQQLDKLQTISAQATTVGLTITGSYQRDVPTESFVVVVEGQQPEQQIFINSHTDGPNDLEENGAIALLTLLQAIKNHDLKFKQTLVFGFVSGHFQIPQSGLANRQATSRLLRDFEAYETKHNIAIQKVLGLTIEHLGGAEYEDDLKQNALKLKSPDDPMFIYISNAKNKTLVEQCLTEINPVGQYFLLKARKTAYFGEGQPLFQAGWPTISFIAMPLALCQLGAAETEPDINTMYDQINLILAILIASTQQLDV